MLFGAAAAVVFVCLSPFPLLLNDWSGEQLLFGESVSVIRIFRTAIYEFNLGPLPALYFNIY